MRFRPATLFFIYGILLLLFTLAAVYWLGFGPMRALLDQAGMNARPGDPALGPILQSRFIWTLAGIGALGILLAWAAARRLGREEAEPSLTEKDWRDYERARSEPLSTAGPLDPKDIFIPGRNFSELLGRIGDQDSLLLTMINSMNEGVLFLNESGRIVLLNPSARRILDVTEEGALGRHYLEVVRHAGLADLLGQSKGQEEVAHGELDIAGTEERTFSVNVGAVREEGGRVLGQIVVFADITALKRLMKMRSEFVANVSHELKTPLTAILGYVETLQTGALEDKKNRAAFLGKIADQSHRLHALIEDVLELSRIEGGRWAESPEPVDLREHCEAAMEILKAKAEAKRIVLKELVPGGLSVKALPDGLQRVLVNLLDNAVKYSPEGTTVTLSAQTEGMGLVSIRVTDEGCGISAAHLPRIFERFYRAESSRNRAAGGTGLGLAIVKHLVDRMGGTVSVESAEGKGSAFTVTLPSA